MSGTSILYLSHMMVWSIFSSMVTALYFFYVHIMPTINKSIFNLTIIDHSMFPHQYPNCLQKKYSMFPHRYPNCSQKNILP